ncbi:phage holin family protein [Hazenella sp. IB182357]|uniref:Phage holin family protein n=1 Tax=Polycladospora coralii TaxID=2771432 RepID=A0A926NBB8_9BACL|nr:phage holin family protein [Polycladospora coralii]MBD1372580.1 phage holin family protein [Polycladospora coralii]
MTESFKWIIGTVGMWLSFLLGGWSQALMVLVVFMCIDFLTGILAGFYERKLSSKVGSKGLIKKIGMILIISICHFLDQILETGDMLRDGAVFFYCVNECISIIENAGRMGIKIPAVLQRAIEVLAEKEKHVSEKWEKKRRD